MAGLLDDLLLQPDDSEHEECSADDDSDLELVEASTGDPQEAEEPAELGDLLMGVAEEEPFTALETHRIHANICAYLSTPFTCTTGDG